MSNRNVSFKGYTRAHVTGACLAVGIAGCALEYEEDSPVSHDAARLSVNLAAEEAPEDFGAADLGSGVVTLPPEQIRGQTSQLTPRELDDLRRRPRGDSGAVEGDTVAPDWRAQLRDSVRDERSNEKVRILVTLPDEEFPWREFRNKALTIENREELIDVRKAQLANRLDALEARLSSLGAEEIVRLWIAPAISAMLPASMFDVVSRWGEVAGAARDDNRALNPLQYRTGVEGRNGTRAQAFIAAGYKGQDGHLGTSAATVRAGIFDVIDGFTYTHYGFRRTDGSSRIISRQNCTNGSCFQFSPSQASGHATLVMGVLGGSIEGGQDPNYTSTSTRLRRSGMAPEANLWYYTSTGNLLGSNLYLVAQSAINNALDVLNHSWDWGCVCNRFCDDTGANVVITNSTDSGTLHVVAAGNTGGASCTVTWPGVRRDALVVGGLDTNVVTTPYDTAPIWPNSSRGGMTIRVGGVTQTAALVDLVAPACYTALYTGPAPGSYDTTSCGTSLAAPTVAGNVALALNSFYALGWPGMDARMTQTYMLMMGDGWNSDTGNTMSWGMSTRSGAGRLKNHFMGSGNLTYPWAFGCHKDTLTTAGQVKSYGVWGNPQSSAVTTWKTALTWRETNLDDVADIILRVRNTCPSVDVASDVSWDVRKRIRLGQSSITGKCLVYDVTAVYLPQSRTFTVCDYLQSGSASDH